MKAPSGLGLIAALAVAGCTVDYGVREQEKGPGTPPVAPEEVASDPTVDTEVEDPEEPDAPADSGVAEEETAPPEDTAEPEEPEGSGEGTVACAPGADGTPVGCAAEVGPGRLFVWGDEHVRFEDYRPASDRFWESALTWLAEGGRATVNDRTGSLVVADAASSLGLTLVGGAADIVIVDLWSGATGADISTWLADGRAVMVMGIGFGSSECTYLTAVTSGLPLTFDCAAEPWGPVGTLTDHPIASGLATSDAPFVNGRAVVATDPASARAVAFVR